MQRSNAACPVVILISLVLMAGCSTGSLRRAAFQAGQQQACQAEHANTITEVHGAAACAAALPAHADAAALRAYDQARNDTLDAP